MTKSAKPRRPRVVVEPGSDGKKWFAACVTPRCDWPGYSNTVKSDVQQHATWHRDSHLIGGQDG